MDNLQGDMSNVQFIAYCAIFVAALLPFFVLRHTLILAVGPMIGQDLFDRLLGMSGCLLKFANRKI